MRSLRIGLMLKRGLLAVALLAVWEFASLHWKLGFYISRPTVIAARLYEMASSGALFFNAAFTALHALGGFVLGAAAGLLVGLALGRMQSLAELIEPFIKAFYSLPKVALAPIFVLWFGIGSNMKILFVATIVFFLVFLNTYTGVRNVSREQVNVLRLMGARERHIMMKVVLPSAITWVFAGLNLSVPYALIGAIIGELIASNRGLGFVLADATAQFDTGSAFAALTAIMVLAMALSAAVQVAERRLMPWRAIEERREVSI